MPENLRAHDISVENVILTFSFIFNFAPFFAIIGILLLMKLMSDIDA